MLYGCGSRLSAFGCSNQGEIERGSIAALGVEVRAIVPEMFQYMKSARPGASGEQDGVAGDVCGVTFDMLGCIVCRHLRK